MAQFESGKPISSAEPVIVVDKGLPPGRHEFQLIVEDNLGTVSEAASVLVIIEAQTGPGLFDRLRTFVAKVEALVRPN
jgi:hypothetical protein